MDGFTKGLIAFGAVTVLTGVALRVFVVDEWVIPTDDLALSSSLRPNLSPGDVLYVMRSPGFDQQALVVCDDPDIPGHRFVGRVYGEVGHAIHLEQGVVYTNGKRSPSPRKCDPAEDEVINPKNEQKAWLPCWGEEAGSVGTFNVLRNSSDDLAAGTFDGTVNPGKLIIISDNRVFHQDARDFGQLPKENCHRIVFRLWSAQGFGDDDHRMTWFY